MKLNLFVALTATSVVQAQTLLTCTFPSNWQSFDSRIGNAWKDIQNAVAVLKTMSLSRSYGTVARRSPKAGKVTFPASISASTKVLKKNPSLIKTSPPVGSTGGSGFVPVGPTETAMQQVVCTILKTGLPGTTCSYRTVDVTCD